jgi:hypothetical protein
MKNYNLFTPLPNISLVIRERERKENGEVPAAASTPRGVIGMV